MKKRRRLTEHEENRLAVKATERFLKSGIRIKDVYETVAADTMQCSRRNRVARHRSGIRVI